MCISNCTQDQLLQLPVLKSLPELVRVIHYGLCHHECTRGSSAQRSVTVGMQKIFFYKRGCWADDISACQKH